MIKGNCACWSIVKMWLLLYWEIYRPFLKCICFDLELWWLNCSGFWGRLTKRQRKMILSEECMRSCMFGEERVNNSVDLLSRIFVVFSVGQISVLVTVTHFCCNMLLQMLECYWTCSHARLACFFFRDEPTLHWFCMHCGPMFYFCSEKYHY